MLRSAPRIDFPYPRNANEPQRIAVNQAVIADAPLSAWLPAIEVTTGGATTHVQIGCGAISRPESYSGTNLLTVLSFDLGRDALGDGKPVLLVADGDTVYSNGPSLYVASDLRWKPRADAVKAQPTDARTEIYKFDTTGPRPVFVAGGTVPGHLINQYAMSEWDGALRVASTSEATEVARTTRQSGVYVLAQDGERLTSGGGRGPGQG